LMIVQISTQDHSTSDIREKPKLLTP